MAKHQLWILVLLAVATAGCANGRFLGLEVPRLFGPGPIDYQRNKAAVQDPYPDPDAGPAVVGGRPRGFQKPLPEPVKARWFSDTFSNR